MRVLVVTPPMTQLNTPYPATAYLKGFLNQHGYEVIQKDPSLELALRLFSRKGVTEILTELKSKGNPLLLKGVPEKVQFFIERSHDYLRVVEPTIRFLQGKDPSLALRIVTRDYLPEGSRFGALCEGAAPGDPDPIAWAFGSLGVQDRAKYLASLFLDDLTDVIQVGIDPRFGLTRYGEKLAASVARFEPLLEALEAPPTVVDRFLDSLTDEILMEVQPQLLGLSVPFPGNVYGAFRMARRARLLRQQGALSENLKIVLGGGYVNTELRSLSEPRVFDWIDYVTLDDGERPFLSLLEMLQKKRPQDSLLRTFVRESHQVVFKNDPKLHDIPHRETGTPSYEGLALDQYLSIFEMLNPMHRIWSDGRWNKLTLAHGCYWRKCNFCDISLDYIGRYDTAPVQIILDRIEALIRETGQTGFHFVDEAAPPAMLRALSQALIEKGISITWWGNIRFEKTFTPELARLMAQSGCVAVSGGLEVASDRLLKKMQKGVTVEQVARVTQALTQSGIMVHAYLMYGFPTQTTLETVDALERVRQLFEAGCIQSAYWHRFSATIHSPIGKNPSQFGIQVKLPSESAFAQNDLEFVDPTPCDHEFLGEGLRKALYNYMHGAGLDWDVREWFGKKGGKYQVPRPSVPQNLIQKALYCSG